MVIEINDKETKERIGKEEDKLSILIVQNDIMITLLRKIGHELVGIHYK